MIADAAYVRGVGNLPPDTANEAIAPHLDAAGIRLRRWVGPTAYADAESVSPADPERKLALKLAEAHLALAVAFTSFAGTYRENQGFQGGGSLMEGQASYLSPKQVAVLQEDHLAQAEALARPYLLPGVLLAGQALGAGR